MSDEQDPGQVWRTGRSLGRTLYIQVGEEPSQADRCVGMVDSPELAERIVAAVNETTAEPEQLRAELAEATNENALLRETLAESDLGAQVLAQWEAIAAADADRDRLANELAETREKLAELRDLQVGIKSLTTDSGAVEMSLHMAHDMMRAYVAGFVKILNSEDAPNYVELAYSLRNDPERYTVTIQRSRGKTPAEVAGEAKQQARTAEAERDALRTKVTAHAFAADAEVARLAKDLQRAVADWDQLSSDLTNFMRRNTELIDERDALKAAIARVRDIAVTGRRTSIGRVYDYVPAADVLAALAVPETTPDAPTGGED